MKTCSKKWGDAMTPEDLKRDFKLFVTYQFARLGLPKPTPIQQAICDELQYNDEHMLLLAFRGVGKSWLTSLFVVWKLWQDPQLEFLVVSASSPRAIEFATFTKRILKEDPLLKDIAPDRKLGLRDSVLAFDVKGKRPSHAPSVKAAGITGQITGSRADIIIADDVEIPNNSYSVETRRKLLEQVNELTNVLKPNGRLIFLGTPQTEDSIYKKLLKTGIYVPRFFPALYPASLEPYQNGQWLAPILLEQLQANPHLAGQPTEPSRFPKELLEERRLSIGAKAFALQYMLDMNLTDIDKYPLKMRDIIIAHLETLRAPLEIAWAPSWNNRITDLENFGFEDDELHWPGIVSKETVEYEHMVMSIDPAGKGSDETAWAIVGFAAGKLFVLDFGGTLEPVYDDKVLHMLVKKVVDFRVKEIVIEENFGQGMLARLLLPILKQHKAQARITEVRSTTQKEKRILAHLEPLFLQHKLVLNYSALMREHAQVKNGDIDPTYSLHYQLTHITDERHALEHDDRIDALAMAVGVFKDRLQLSEAEARERIQERLFEEEIRRWEMSISQRRRYVDYRDRFNKLYR